MQGLSWPHTPVADRSDPRVSHVFARSERGVSCRTTTEEKTFEVLIEYALGSNEHARTFVGRDGVGQAWEMRVSQYPSEPRWDRTIRHPEVPRDPSDYVGRPLDAEPVRRCVHCHTTNHRAAQHPEGRREAADRGIGCERCHGPGAHHLKAVSEQFPDLAIARPSAATAEQVVALGGQCHTSIEPMSSS
jgi:hypothetical protein